MAPEELLRALADGKLHSGEELARHFGVTRAAVWKRMSQLEDWGIRVEATPGVGYRIAEPIELLDLDELSSRLSDSRQFVIDRIDLFSEVASTNRHLIENPPSDVSRLAVCLAEFQTAGRGRRGRAWNAPYGACLCLSVAWRFGETPEQLPALTLAVGVVTKRVLARVAGVDIELKWPNDLVHEERKLGGILVELTAESHAQCQVIIGLGLNLALPAGLLSALCDWPHGAIDLSRAQSEVPVDRHELCSALIREYGAFLTEYPRTGFAPYADEWRAADHLLDRAVYLHEGLGPTAGVAKGIDDDAALLIESDDGRIRRIISGDVSVRPAQ